MGDFLLYPPVYRDNAGVYLPYDVMAQLNWIQSAGEQPYPAYLMQYAQTVQPVFDSGKLYIIVGDEPNDIPDHPITSYLDATTMANLTNSFQHIPRQKLMDWINTNIRANVDQKDWGKTLRDLVDHYNATNIQALIDNKVNVWVWELMKSLSWNDAYPNDPIPDTFKLTTALIKKHVRDYIASTYEDLDTIADFGYELSRAAAVDKLLKNEDFFDAIALINTYDNLDPAHAALLTKEFEKENLIVDYATQPPISATDHPLAAMNSSSIGAAAAAAANQPVTT